jgi:NAD(P)-dependent dehydrogenase (short-subunit alcohol dehydrogenase family)
MAKRDAKIVVNDLGGAVGGQGGSASAAEAVVAEIVAAGGEAIANADSVADLDQMEPMVAAAMARWGRVDILVNNAGILRDKSFAKMDMADFRAVVGVHLMGSVHCTKAVWDILLRGQNGGGGPDADPRDPWKEDRHSRELPGADGSHAHGGGPWCRPR